MECQAARDRLLPVMYQPVSSTLIGPGMSRLGSHWLKYFHGVATLALFYAIKNHLRALKIPARKGPIRGGIHHRLLSWGYFECLELVLYVIRELA